MLNNVFGFVEHQEKAIYGLGNNLPLTGNIDEVLLDKAAGIADNRTKIDHIHWYESQYTLFIQQQGMLFKQFLSKTATELRYVERSVFMKEVENQNLWNFELGNPESVNIPIRIIIGIQQRDRKHPQNLNIDTFCR